MSIFVCIYLCICFWNSSFCTRFINITYVFSKSKRVVEYYYSLAENVLILSWSLQCSLEDTFEHMMCVCIFLISITSIVELPLSVCTSIHLSISLFQRKLGYKFLRYFDEGRQKCFFSWSKPKLAVWLTNKLSTDFCCLARYDNQICIVLLTLRAFWSVQFL